MNTTFIYQVKGFEYRDTEAFGQAWKEAKAKAAELHTGIFRTVIKKGEERYEFFAKGGVFLNNRYYEHNEKIF